MNDVCVKLKVSQWSCSNKSGYLLKKNVNIRSSMSQAIIDVLALDLANVAQRKINTCL